MLAGHRRKTSVCRRSNVASKHSGHVSKVGWKSDLKDSKDITLLSFDVSWFQTVGAATAQVDGSFPLGTVRSSSSWADDWRANKLDFLKIRNNNTNCSHSRQTMLYRTRKQTGSHSPWTKIQYFSRVVIHQVHTAWRKCGLHLKTLESSKWWHIYIYVKE